MKRIYKITTSIVTEKEADRIVNDLIVSSWFQDPRLIEFQTYSEELIKGLLLVIDESIDLVLFDEFLLSKYISIITKMGIKAIVVEDITNDLFTGKMPIPDVIKEQIEEYLLNTHNADDVLDKMLEGIELTNIDKLILAK